MQVTKQRIFLETAKRQERNNRIKAPKEFNRDFMLTNLVTEHPGDSSPAREPEGRNGIARLIYRLQTAIGRAGNVTHTITQASP